MASSSSTSWWNPFKKSNQNEPTSFRLIYSNDPERNVGFPSNVISNTKYTLWNFVPKNIFEQFGRAMNVYFLFIGILQLFPTITPVDPISTWGALIFIFTISAIKEAYDDYNRYKRDKKANERLYWVLRDGSKVQIKSQDIAVGDIVYLTNDSEVPCDMVILKTSDPEGSCYVQTANLDGETDLKTRLSPLETMNLELNDLLKLKGVIECSQPNAEIYRFDARLSLKTNNRVNTYSHSDWITLSAQNLVLQATHIRNTDYIYALTVYTGNETKIGKNKKTPPTKWTKLDKLINKITIFIFCLQLSFVFIFGAIGESLRRSRFSHYWYLDYPSDEPWYEFLIIPLRFLLLNSLMIPISLKVTIDVIKYAYALFINWDLKMYNQSADSPAVANSTALSEDLGQIEYVFTDKTGTLTENIMIFSKCSIDGEMYGGETPEHNALQDQNLLDKVHSNHPTTIEFFKSLSLCHSVIPIKLEDNKYQYKASSPDEEALVNASSSLDIKFIAKSATTLTLQVLGEVQEYKLLHTFEFTSDRKRMSVVIRDLKSGVIRIITKGADDVIFARLHPNHQTGALVRQSTVHIDDFASQGLRTLCISEKVIPETDYQAWLVNHYQEASTSLENRTTRLAQAYQILETDLNLLGITAIEDKLQDQVPETIHNLRQASIRVWMLTGDKYSTAIQIATSCNMIERGCKIYTVGKSWSEMGNHKTGAASNLTPKDIKKSISDIYHDIVLNRQQQMNNDSSLPSSSSNNNNNINDEENNLESTIIVEGHVLDMVLNFASQEFIDLSHMVSSVICCRVTPNQKALVVRMIKNTGKICLSIGDGGNDVSMIQEANIGVGISGREGLQASRAADYSISRFKYLKELLFIHGRYSYLRTSFVANYCFYKSLFICFIQILYQLFCGFGGTTFFNSFSLTSYNILFTGLPIIGYILDRDLPKSILRRNPYLYTHTQEGKSFSVQVFMTWAFRSITQALLVFIITLGPYLLSQDGSAIDYNSVSMISFSAIIFIQSFTLFFESNTITWINQLLIWGTIPIYIICVAVMNQLPTLDFYSIMSHLCSSWEFWGSIILMSLACLLPIIALEYIYLLYRPNVNEIINQIRNANNSIGHIKSSLCFGQGLLSKSTTTTTSNKDSSSKTKNLNSSSENTALLKQSARTSHRQRFKTVKFLCYKKLSNVANKRYSPSESSTSIGSNQVIELLVGTFDDEEHTYANQQENLIGSLDEDYDDDVSNNYSDDNCD